MPTAYPGIGGARMPLGGDQAGSLPQALPHFPVPYLEGPDPSCLGSGGPKLR